MDQLLSLDAASKRLGVGMTLVRRLVREGQLASCRVGSRRLVPSREIDRFIEERLAGDRQAH
jgi:excisionase family DNA binding protein